MQGDRKKVDWNLKASDEVKKLETYRLVWEKINNSETYDHGSPGILEKGSMVFFSSYSGTMLYIS